nr:MAG TPA: hypothetical protein [Caudoviricetes sp.]DAV17614.1 MAG TPA: hypothetical protein [Caudoviricetes sp.]
MGYLLVTSVPSRLNGYISYLVVRQRSFSMWTVPVSNQPLYIVRTL